MVELHREGLAIRQPGQAREDDALRLRVGQVGRERSHGEGELGVRARQQGSHFGATCVVLDPERVVERAVLLGQRERALRWQQQALGDDAWVGRKTQGHRLFDDHAVQRGARVEVCCGARRGDHWRADRVVAEVLQPLGGHLARRRIEVKAVAGEVDGPEPEG